jgi:PAS domain S-box-containing protein
VAYSSRQIAWAAFALAVVLLALIGIVSYRATNKLVASEKLVSHTHEVQTVLEDLRSDLMEVAYARRGYIIISNEEELAGYDLAVRDLPGKLSRLSTLLSDNSFENERLQVLRSLIDRDLGVLQQSIDLRRSGRPDQREQVAFTRLGTTLTHQTQSVIQEMTEHEAKLLEQRIGESVRLYRRTVTVLATAFLLAILLLYANFFRLNLELKERERAERAARDSEHLINAFFSSSTVGFAIIDSELRFERMNHVLAEMAGLEAQTFAGKAMGEVPGSWALDIEACAREVLSTGHAVLDRTMSRGDPGERGQARHWTVNCFPIPNARGEITKVGITSLDVTERKDAEAAARSLSSRLLRLQDEERRRIARELHDSLGQYLTALKINLELAREAEEPRKRELLADAVKLADGCLTETRTISHLLHPPLLDEAGFASAANWYVQGFAERSGLDVNIDVPSGLKRMPAPVETALFRVLQESLTNIHRHAQSTAAEIQLQVEAELVRLTVLDDGRGIPREFLERFRQDGTQSGVGLAGMRERIRELGGRLDIDSGERGTKLTAEIPLPQREQSRGSEGVSAA